MNEMVKLTAKDWASDRRQFIADAIRQRLDDGHERAA